MRHWFELFCLHGFVRVRLRAFVGFVCLCLVLRLALCVRLCAVVNLAVFAFVHVVCVVLCVRVCTLL